MAEHLLKRLRNMHWPVPQADHPVPQAGQLWRVACNGSAGLVVVVGSVVEGKAPVVVAAANHVGDDRTVDAQTDNGMRASVWAALRSDITVSVLDHRIGDLTPESLAAVTAVAEGLRVGDWAPISSILDDRFLIRLDLEAKIEGFASTGCC